MLINIVPGEKVSINNGGNEFGLIINVGAGLLLSDKDYLAQEIEKAFDNFKGAVLKGAADMEINAKKTLKDTPVLLLDFFDNDNERTSMISGPSLGNIFLAMGLRKKGFLRVGFDRGDINSGNEDIIERIKKEKIKVLGISIITPHIEELKAVRELAKKIRQANKDIIIAVGGPSVSLALDLIAVHIPEANIIVAGEAEEAFPSILSALAGNNASEDIPLDYAATLKTFFGTYLRFGQTSFAAHLDYLNYFSSLDKVVESMKIEFSFLKEEAIKNGMVFITSRGCPYKCTFCAQIMGTQYRTFSPENIKKIFSEYKKHVQALFKAKKISQTEMTKAMVIDFVDDDFFLNKTRAKEILKEIKTLGFSCRSISVSVRSFFKSRDGRRVIDREIFELIAKLGSLDKIYIGIDGFTDSELKRLGKGGKSGYTLEEAKQIIAMCQEYDIKCTSFFILINSQTAWDDFWEALFTLDILAQENASFGIWGNSFLEYYVNTPAFFQLVSAPDFDQDLLVTNKMTVKGFPEYGIIFPVIYKDGLARVSAQMVAERFTALTKVSQDIPVKAILSEAMAYMLLYSDKDGYGMGKSFAQRKRVIGLFDEFISRRLEIVEEYLSKSEKEIWFACNSTSRKDNNELAEFVLSLESLILMNEIFDSLNIKLAKNKDLREALTDITPGVEAVSATLSNYAGEPQITMFSRYLEKAANVLSGDISRWRYLGERFRLGETLFTQLEKWIKAGVPEERIINNLNLSNPGLKSAVFNALNIQEQDSGQKVIVRKTNSTKFEKLIAQAI
ncbi:MAG: radical SAM protein [Candidatus Omnitrophica bacterium]|nr:radical SAM protein [Candidatus Omnitrophota bacterium]